MVRDKKELLYNLYSKNYETAYRRAYYILKDPGLAQDAVQDAFIKVYDNMDQLRNVDKMVAWLMVIVKNCAIVQLGKRGRDIAVEDPTYYEKRIWDKKTPDLLVEEKELRRVIVDILNNELSQAYQDVIILKYYYELSYEDIAKVLDIKIGTVKSRIHRAKQAIAKAIEKHWFHGRPHDPENNSGGSF
jgi:RNA polymerase sigma-70 factor (ECF subfamily)